VFHKLGGDPRPLFSPNVFYPHQLTLTYSDSMLLPALTTVPFLVVGLHPVVAYNLVLVLSFVASALAMYLLAVHLTGSRPAAFVAGLLFGFHPFRFEHYSHFELQMTYCMPLALLALHRFLATARTRDAMAFGLLAPAVYSSISSLSSSRVCWRSSCLCLLARPLRRLLGPAALAGALALLLALPLARTYSSAKLGDREADTVAYYSATTADYLRAHPRSATWGHRTLPGRMPERALFPGAVILLLAAVALIPPLGATRAAYAVALLVIFELSRVFNSAFYPYLTTGCRSFAWRGWPGSIPSGLRSRRWLPRRAPYAGWTVGVAQRARSAARRNAIGRPCRGSSRLARAPAIYDLVSGARDVVLASSHSAGTLPASRTCIHNFALALRADHQWLQRTLPAGAGRLRGRSRTLPGCGGRRPAARARGDARHDQLRALSRRLRGPGRDC
jgi:hypothetical protein